MTWNLSRRPLRLAVFGFVTFALSGVAGLGFVPSPPAVALSRNCADTFARAWIGSAAGAFNCQDPSLQERATESGVTSDADIADFTKSYGFSEVRPIGATDGVAVYDLDNGQAVLILYLDKDGKVTSFQRGSRS